jgi:hypothetical protein
MGSLAVPDLITVLNATDPKPKSLAAFALSEIGSSAKDAISSLEPLVKVRDQKEIVFRFHWRRIGDPSATL